MSDVTSFSFSIATHRPHIPVRGRLFVLARAHLGWRGPVTWIGNRVKPSFWLDWEGQGKRNFLRRRPTPLSPTLPR